MKNLKIITVRVLLAAVALGLSGILTAFMATAADNIPEGFDMNGQKIFDRYNETPLAAMSGTGGRRNLDTYYELRQYPGSPPRIPHRVYPSFDAEAQDCLACHGKGGYDVEQDAFAPVTPHPEKELCYQCHVPMLSETLFVESNWRSLPAPKLGNTQQMGGSPPGIPHTLQMRDDCIACHTGPAAVAEIRVDHGERGNCRQCHVPLPAAEPVSEFTRNK